MPAPKSYPDDPTDILREVLSLKSLGYQQSSALALFEGHTPPQTRGRVFGGQVMAQALMAAIHTVEDERFLHSMHCYFVRAGDASIPIEFSVQNIRDGRSFSVRQIQAWQHNKVILQLTCSFQTEASGIDHYEPMPDNVPEPESLPSLAELLGDIDNPVARDMVFGRAFDIRHISQPIYTAPADEISTKNMLWMKTYTPLDASVNVHNAALAYGSDYTLLEPIMRAHGWFWADRKANKASLDHAVWFHRPAPVEQWLLYVQESPSAQNSRGFATGRFYTQDGVLVASVAQEGMMRHSDF